MTDILEDVLNIIGIAVVVYFLAIPVVVIVGGLLAYPLTLIASPFVALYRWATGQD